MQLDSGFTSAPSSWCPKPSKFSKLSIRDCLSFQQEQTSSKNLDLTELLTGKSTHFWASSALAQAVWWILIKIRIASRTSLSLVILLTRWELVTRFPSNYLTLFWSKLSWEKTLPLKISSSRLVWSCSNGLESLKLPKVSEWSWPRKKNQTILFLCQVVSRAAKIRAPTITPLKTSTLWFESS